MTLITNAFFHFALIFCGDRRQKEVPGEPVFIEGEKKPKQERQKDWKDERMKGEKAKKEKKQQKGEGRAGKESDKNRMLG